MSRNYEFNKQAAEEANAGGKRINEPGAYVGTFRAAWYEQNQKGTESVNFIFESDAGQEVNLTLYTHNGDGDELRGFKHLNAIMACMRIRKLEARNARVKLYDFQSRADVEKEKETYPALMEGKVGLVLQAEEYRNGNGDVKQRMLIAAAFDAQSRQMADEILSKASNAKALDRFLNWFESNKVRKLQERGGSQPSSDVNDDDIPF